MKKYHQHLAFVLVICMMLAMLPAEIFASSQSTVSTDLEQKSFTVNAATEFTVTTHGNDDAGKMVLGSFTVKQNGQEINLQEVAKLEYQESSSGAWYEFYGDFGPASGFPMGEGDVTSHFKVTFRQAGSYDVKIAMVTANEAREVLCEVQKTITVAEAHNASTVSTNLAEQRFTVNAATEFTVTTHGNDDAGKTVWGSFTVQQNGQDINLQDVAKLEYQESSSGAWYEFYGDFGPSTGFPMGKGDVTSHFKVTFRQAGSYDVRIAMVTANEAREVLCEVQKTITVAEAHNASTVSTNLAEQSFTVNAATEFTVTTHGNDDAGRMVLGSFTVKQNGQDINLQDVAKLEYQESSSGAWYEFYGDFGPASGFPMGEGDVTSHFRVTFRQAGSYDVKIAMVTANEAREEICAVNTTITVQKEKVTVSVVKEGNGKIEMNGEEVTGASISVNKNEEVSVTITPEPGSYIKTLTIAGESKSVEHGRPYTEILTFDADGTIEVKFVAEYTVTVASYDSDAGSVTLDGQSVDSITVDAGTEVSVCVSAKEGYWIQSVTIGGEEQSLEASERTGKTVQYQVVRDCTVSVSFVRVFQVAVRYDDTIGSVSVAGATVANEGSVTVKETDGSITVEAKPNTHYHISALKINGVPEDITAENRTGYTKKLPAEKDYEIEVVFAPDTYTITFQQSGYDGVFTDLDGKALTEYTLVVEYKKSAQFRFVPKEGYAAWVYDGESELTTEDGIYRIENVAAPHTISVKTKDVQAPSVTPTVSDAAVWKQEKKVTFTTQDNSGGAVTVYVSDTEYLTLAALREAGLEAVTEYTAKASGIYYIYAVDASENFAKTEVRVTMIDTTPPDISQPQRIETGRDYDQSITYTFTVTDGESGVQQVSYGKEKDGSDAVVLTPSAEGYQFTVTENGTYYIFAVDNAGNHNDSSVAVENIDPTAPVIFDVTASDAWDAVSNTIAFSVSDDYGVKGAYWSETEYTQESEIIANAVELEAADGKYEFSVDENGTYYIYALDEAGNVAKQSVSVTHIDKEKPTGSISASENTWSQLIGTLTFGIWKNTTVEVSAVGDDGAGSGVKKVLYYKSDADIALTRDELQELYLQNQFSEESVKVEKDEKFVVYVRIEDNVGNYDFISTDGIIYDHTESVITIQPEAPNGNDYYNSDVTVGILVKENLENVSAYSGIQEIRYTVETDGVTTQEQLLYRFTKDEQSGEIKIEDWASGEKVETILTGDVPLYGQLAAVWEGKITVDAEKNNSDNVVVTVFVKDNAGNGENGEIKESRTLKISSSPLTATLTSEDEPVNTVGGHGYFSILSGRTMVLTITDREGTFDEVAASEGFHVTATDVKGRPIKDDNGDVIEKPYSLGEWNNEGNTHSVTVTFPYDGNYKWSYQYTNKADYSIVSSAEPTDEETEKSTVSVIDATECAFPFAFTVDTEAPTDGKISAVGSTWEELLQVLTFGLYSKETVEVVATAEDAISDFQVLYYKSNSDTAIDNETLEELYRQGKFSEEPVKVDRNELFAVYACFVDNAKNKIFISTDGIIYDDRESTITLSLPETEYEYYNSSVKIGVVVKETADDISTYSGIQEIRYTVETDGVTTQEQLLYSFTKDEQTGEIKIEDWASGEKVETTLTGDVPLYDQLTAVWEGKITVDAKKNNSDNVVVTVFVKDNAGNGKNGRAEQSCTLSINTTPPTATLTSTDTAANTVAGHSYFAAGRTLTLTVTDRATTFNEDSATNGFSVTAKDAKGNPIKDAKGNVIDKPYTLSKWSHNGDTHSVTVTFPYDGNYQWSYQYTNKAGLSVASSEINTDHCASPFDFTIDTTAPTGTVTVKSAEGREAQWTGLAQGGLHFGFWSRKRITLQGAFEDLTSPIAKVEYYKVSATHASDGTVALTPQALNAVTEWKPFEGFDVLANAQFVVYIKVTDQAGNYYYLSTDGLIVDDKAPVAEQIAPEITLQPQQPVNDIYNGDVKVDITVIDPLVGGTYSGLKTVTYQVFNMGKLTQEGSLFTFNSQNPQQGDLKPSYSGSIVVDSKLNNSNDVIVKVCAEDNAANGTENEITLKIDTTVPTINVSYDNNNADSQTYFKADRTATIVVTERNFAPEDVQVKITGTGGSTPTLSAWRETKGSGNLDDTHWTATVTYSVDGDYSFDIAYTDLANNPCPGVQYGNSAAPKAFTIDKTFPVIRVTYDNNEVQNTNYYKAARTATIVISEHNFSADRVQITLTASDDGAAAETPAVSGWTNNGDTHTATIAFTDDAFYGFDIAYTDLAGNAAADFERQSFYIDQTPPVLTITGVKDKSANKGDVIPKITYSDTNLDADTVEITLVGANRKSVVPEGEYQEIHNGAEFTFKNFEEKKEIDDIYTLHAKLTDKAGNTSEEVITFSVNRFGSTYALSAEAEKLNGTYVQTPIDVVITETNADPIKNIKLTMFKNNETIVLTEGEDYVVELTGGEGQWYCYAYTIFAKNFENDGVYRLALHSEDAAGNVAENTLDTKESAIGFGVDSTNPTITVTNLESDETYALESIRVSMSANDNLMLASVAVYLDDYDKVYKSWSAEEVAEILSTGNSFEFDVDGNSTKAHKVKIVCTDAAGNETIEEITDFYVTTNLFVRFYTNTPLFIGSIVGVVALIGVIIFLIAKKKKTNKAVNAK